MNRTLLFNSRLLTLLGMVFIYGCGGGTDTTGSTTTPSSTTPVTTVETIDTNVSLGAEYPPDQKTGVTLSGEIEVTFALDMDPETINIETFLVQLVDKPVKGKVKYSATTRTATFVPDQPLDPAATYTVTVTTAVKDAKGRPLSKQYATTFSTGSSHSYFVFITSTGKLSVFALDLKTGLLKEAPGSPFTAGSPIAVSSVHPREKYVYVADPGARFTFSGGVRIFGIEPITGALTEFDASPFFANFVPYAAGLSPDGKHAYVTSLLNQEVYSFSVRIATALMTEISGSPLADTTVDSLTMDPNGKFVYGYTSQRPGRSSISVYLINPDTGVLSAASGSPFMTESAAQVVVHPSGKFIYSINTSSSVMKVSGFSVDSSTGALTSVPGSPYEFDRLFSLAMHPNGKYLYSAHVISGPDPENYGIRLFIINETTGALTQGDSLVLGTSTFATGLAAVDPTGQYLVIVHDPSTATSRVLTYAINQNDGTLTLVDAINLGLFGTSMAVYGFFH